MPKHILLTGIHRSGSTWAGTVLSQARNTLYVHEPFNIDLYTWSPLNCWFQYLSGSPAKEQDKAFRYLNTFSTVFNYRTIFKFFKIRSVEDAKYLWTHVFSNRNNRYVYKDPLAFLSAEWIYKRLNWEVVIMIRHPAAFVASLKDKDWKFDFNDFLKQKKLLNTCLKDYAGTISEYAREEKDLVSQGILLWNIVYSTVYYYRKKYDSNWYFVRHEDLSEAPLEEYQRFFDFLDLEFDDNVKAYIEASTRPASEDRLKRDAKRNITLWKKRLSASEIARIKAETQPVWEHFYSEEEWK